MSSADRPQKPVAGGTHAPSSAGAEQLPLLPGHGDGERDGLLPIPEAAISRPAPPGAGRPAGARNRRTDLMAGYIVGRYGDPLEGEAALGMMDTRALIRELRTIASECGMKLDLTVREVLAMQADARRAVLPYIHAKRAAEDVTGNAVDLPVVGLGTVVKVEAGATVNVGAARSVEDEIERRTIEVKPTIIQGDSDAPAE